MINSLSLSSISILRQYHNCHITMEKTYISINTVRSRMNAILKGYDKQQELLHLYENGPSDGNNNAGKRSTDSNSMEDSSSSDSDSDDEMPMAAGSSTSNASESQGTPSQPSSSDTKAPTTSRAVRSTPATPVRRSQRSLPLRASKRLQTQGSPYARKDGLNRSDPKLK